MCVWVCKIGHTYLTHSFLLKTEYLIHCITCDCCLTVKRILFNCVDFIESRNSHCNVKSFKELLKMSKYVNSRHKIPTYGYHSIRFFCSNRLAYNNPQIPIGYVLFRPKLASFLSNLYLACKKSNSKLDERLSSLSYLLPNISGIADNLKSNMYRIALCCIILYSTLNDFIILYNKTCV